MAEFPILTFAVIVAVIVGLGLVLFYVLKRLPNYVGRQSPQASEERRKDEAFNGLNTLSSLVRMARQQGKDVADISPVLRDARTAYETKDYEGAARASRIGKEMMMARGLTLKKEIVQKSEAMSAASASGEEGGPAQATEEPTLPVPPTLRRPVIETGASSPHPAPPPRKLPQPIPRPPPLAANGGRDEPASDEADEGSEEKTEAEEEFETAASVLRRHKPKNYMEAKFMMMQVENFLTNQERAGKINKDARRELEEAKRHFKEGDYDMSLALSARAKRASGQIADFVKVAEKEEGAMPEGDPEIEGVPTGAPAPGTSRPVARPPPPSTRAPAAGAKPCPSCGAVVEPRDKFCRGCGTPNSRSCPKCGEAFRPNDKFCGQCGAMA